MTASISQPVVLDAAVLGNFASSGTTGELVDVLEQPVSVPAVPVAGSVGSVEILFIRHKVE